MLGLMIFSFVIFTFLLESISLVEIVFGFYWEWQGKISDKMTLKQISWPPLGWSGKKIVISDVEERVS